jgi:two-component system, NarL family, nitrate/nitrite response regulator NarL
MSTPLLVTHPCALVRDGLHQIFAKSQFRPVQLLASLNEAAKGYLEAAGICVWLVGVREPGRGINEMVRRMVTANPHVKAVILAASHADQHVMPALEAGACGLLCEDIPGNQLIKSLELIVLGETVTYPEFHRIGMAQRTSGPQELGEFHAGTAVMVARRSDEPQAPTPRALDPRIPYLAQSVPANESTGDPSIALSRRETVILRTLTEGASNKVIARKLVITESTVKVHMKAILRKLRLQNRTQAAMWARTHLGELAA